MTSLELQVTAVCLLLISSFVSWICSYTVENEERTSLSRKRSHWAVALGICGLIISTMLPSSQIQPMSLQIVSIMFVIPTVGSIFLEIKTASST